MDGVWVWVWERDCVCVTSCSPHHSIMDGSAISRLGSWRHCVCRATRRARLPHSLTRYLERSVDTTVTYRVRVLIRVPTLVLDLGFCLGLHEELMQSLLKSLSLLVFFLQLKRRTLSTSMAMLVSNYLD